MSNCERREYIEFYYTWLDGSVCSTSWFVFLSLSLSICFCLFLCVCLLQCYVLVFVYRYSYIVPLCRRLNRRWNGTLGWHTEWPTRELAHAIGQCGVCNHIIFRRPWAIAEHRRIQNYGADLCYFHTYEKRTLLFRFAYICVMCDVCCMCGLFLPRCSFFLLFFWQTDWVYISAMRRESSFGRWKIRLNVMWSMHIFRAAHQSILLSTGALQHSKFARRAYAVSTLSSVSSSSSCIRYSTATQSSCMQKVYTVSRM